MKMKKFRRRFFCEINLEKKGLTLQLPQSLGLTYKTNLIKEMGTYDEQGTGKKDRGTDWRRR